MVWNDAILPQKCLTFENLPARIPSLRISRELLRSRSSESSRIREFRPGRHPASRLARHVIVHTCSAIGVPKSFFQNPFHGEANNSKYSLAPFALMGTDVLPFFFTCTHAGSHMCMPSSARRSRSPSRWISSIAMVTDGITDVCRVQEINREILRRRIGQAQTLRKQQAHHH